MAKDPSHPAPGSLEVVRQFVNTEDVYGDEDLLTDLETARPWLAAHHLVTEPARTDEIDRAMLRRMRKTLRDLAVATTTGEPPPGSVIEELNALTSNVGSRPEFRRLDSNSTARLASTLVATQQGASGAVAILAAAVHDAVRDGTWLRLKACTNPECTWLFYDTSRSRTGRWCSMWRASRFPERDPNKVPPESEVEYHDRKAEQVFGFV